jgi:hypothetical protein
MLGYSSGGILDRKEHGPNPRIMQIMADQLLVCRRGGCEERRARI